MNFMPENVDFSDNEKKRKEEKINKLKFIERQFQRMLEDWHFEMLQYFDEPIKIFSWFKDVKKNGDKLYFDGKTIHGIVAFNFVESHYRFNLTECFGDIEVILAENGRSVKKFFTQRKEKIHNKTSLEDLYKNIKKMV